MVNLSYIFAVLVL